MRQPTEGQVLIFSTHFQLEVKAYSHVGQKPHFFHKDLVVSPETHFAPEFDDI